MNIENYKLLFEANQKELKFPNWLIEKQKMAFEIFSKTGLPTQKDEEWKYTNISAIDKISFVKSKTNNIQIEEFEKIKIKDFNLIPIINNVVDKNQIKCENGIKIYSLAEMLDINYEFVKNYFFQSQISYKDSIASLNTSLLDDVLFIEIDKNIEILKPIHILNIQTENANNALNSTRIAFNILENSKVTIFEEFLSLSENVYWNNYISEFYISSKSNVEHIKLQNEYVNAFHISNNAFFQKENSYLNSVNISLGGKISRSESKVFLCDKETNASLNGLYISSDKQLIDNHTFIEHKKENCDSHELFKGILFDESRSVFNGKIYVHAEAQKTDSKQTNKNLLLSENATIDTKPQLEIFADDVKCTHGGTVGGLDKLSLFYLESRGINPQIAKGILTVGFASEVTDLIENNLIRQKIDSLIVNKIRKSIGSDEVPEIAHKH